MIDLKKNWRIVLAILIVVALGLFIMNQFIEFQYKAQLLADPCGVCMSLGNTCHRNFLININWSEIEIVK
jgi:hypothetical protein